MLSAEEVVKCRKKSASHPITFSFKEFEPNGSIEEEYQVERALDEIKNVISTERIKKLGSLSQALWKPELQLAEVTHHVGSHWLKIGHTINKKLYIYPEEALYLLEMGALELTYNGVPVSVQRAYFVLVGPTNGVSLENYRVFSYLNGAGFKVARHLPQNLKQFCQKNNIEEKEIPETSLKRDRLCSESSTQDLECSKKLKKDNTNLSNNQNNIKHIELLQSLKIFDCFKDYEESNLKIDYDIYLLSGKKPSFRKSCPSLPDYRLIVHRGDEPAPTFSSITTLTKKYDDNVPLINAIVFPDHIAFYSINNVVLPDAFNV